MLIRCFASSSPQQSTRSNVRHHPIHVQSSQSSPGEHSGQEAGGRPTEARANLGPQGQAQTFPSRPSLFIISRWSCWRAAFPLPAAVAAAATCPARNLSQETLQSSLRPACNPVSPFSPSACPPADKECLCAGAQDHSGVLRSFAPSSTSRRMIL
ncbi:hypothetical protein TgHK011_000290 [Trichoderma gracile]|nr:hypothetical protein TgHK011_000290 [Trichoderma gracile]